MVLNKKTIGNTLIIIAIFILGYFIGKSHIVTPDIKEQEKQIEYIYDTIKGRDSIIVRYKDKVKDLKDKTPDYPKECEPIVKWKDSIINTQDTIILLQDTTIYQYDTIVKIQKEIINKCVQSSRKFNFGIQAGYGASREGLTEYIGLGITYNPFRK